MRRFSFWFSILVPAFAVVCGVCCGSFALGVPGEWVWTRVAPTEMLWLAIGPVLIAAALYVGFVWLGAQRVERSRAGELPVWIFGLVICGFAWLWIAQEGAPDNFQLSKAVWILYYRGSSGYFSEANEEAGDLAAYLAGYERKMAQGDVLHIGTHPPGLTVAFRVLLGLCREFPPLVNFALATQPDSVRDVFDALDSTNSRPQPLSGAERAVLWLAALLVQASAALAIVPLFGLLRKTCSRRASWLAVAFWPTMPALALFLPKADCLYPLLATAFLWLWLTALARRSRLLSALAGLVLWVSLTLSLAFLPIALVALLTSCWTIARVRQRPQIAPEISNRTGLDPDCPQPLATPIRSPSEGVKSRARSRFGLVRNAALFAAGGLLQDSAGAFFENCRRLLPAAGWGALGFAVPCLTSWWFLKLNLLTVWWLNFQNHAGFYRQWPRTYWKWLLVNPIELTVAAGAPLTVVAIWSIVGQCRKARAQQTGAQQAGHVWAWLLTLGLLWLSGKNMGEAARLWILLMPFLVWSAGALFESTGFESAFSREAQPSAIIPAGEMCISGGCNGWCVALGMQLVTTAAIVTQVAGFHYPITTT